LYSYGGLAGTAFLLGYCHCLRCHFLPLFSWFVSIRNCRMIIANARQIVDLENDGGNRGMMALKSF